MPVSANILIVSNTEEQRIAECLTSSGYAIGHCTEGTFSEDVINNNSYDLVIKVTSGPTPNVDAISDLPVPVLLIGPNPSPATFQSVPTQFSDLEIKKRLASLIRLQIMQRELNRRAQTTNLYRFQEEGITLPLPENSEPKILVVGKNNERLGNVLLQFDNKASVQICQNADHAIDELRATQFDALILSSVGQGDIHLRLSNDIRADSRLFNLPILFLLEHESNREAAYVHGASDIVIDPGEIENLYARTALHIRQADFRFSLQTLFKTSRPLPVIDGPTGLYSFGFMMAHMKTLVTEHSEEGKFLSVATLNIENLAQINDEFGYPAGDLLLRQVGSIISFLVRGEDFCCRMNNGKFLIALPSTNEKDARFALDRVYGVIRNTEFALAGSDEPVSADVNMGLAEMQTGDTLQQVIDRGLSTKNDT